ncbi:hypothetical protein TZ03_27095 [Pseudomonas sp. 10-1B]|nr:hypothetical protein TZ03_27095 [Pseudomonas sp. 10-1B]
MTRRDIMRYYMGRCGFDPMFAGRFLGLVWQVRPYRRQASSHRYPTMFEPVIILWELACRR